MDYILGIDIGTSGTKTVLFDAAGISIADATQEYPLYQPKNGWAEQDPEDWWRAVCSTCKRVLEESGVSAQEIRGIGLSGQMHSLVMLDEADAVIRPSIIWSDGRTTKQCADITKIVGKERLIAITANPALTGFTASKIMWVKEHEPENYAKCRKLLLPKDYIRYKLTGAFATEVSDASGMQLLDVPNRCWSKEMLSLLEIEESMLGKVYESVEITGYVNQEAAQLTGLIPGIPVVGGAGDNAAAAVGTGVVRDKRAFTTIGTSGVVFAHTSKPKIDPKGRVHTFCCAVPGAWHVMGVVQSAGLSLKWFRDTLCQDYLAEAEVQGVDAYDLMNQAAEQVPLGSNKLLYLPYLMGERTPHLDSDCRGVFFGLSAMHKKQDMIRSVMEGVAFALKDCYSIIEGMGEAPEEMVACGGGSRSKVWRQMLADLYDCPVKTVHTQEGPALGAAILAAVGVGLYDSVEQACDKIIHANPPMIPIAEHTAQYEKLYPIYTRLYGAMKAEFDALAALEMEQD